MICTNCGAERQIYHPCPKCGQPTFRRPPLRVGATVEVHDPLGYSGEGVVEEIQTKPHEAVLVKMHSITDRTDQSVVGRSVWVLTGHVTPIRGVEP